MKGEETLLCQHSLPDPEKGKEESQRGHTGLMSIWALTGDVVINHIFLQGRKSESVDW